MKFVHIADIHLDSPFVNLSNKQMLGEQRRLDQRKALKKVITYIKEKNIPYLFISGDLYEHKYIKQSTIEYINNLFKEIPETKIFISPGNHDPYLKNSYYNKYEWNSNVKIFKSEIEKISFENIDIYGYGFNDFYCTDCEIQEFNIEDPSKLNILVIHCTLDGASIEEKQYNSISRKTLESKGFDYVAMGHIHKKYYKDIEKQNIVYPGSVISLGFDELGKHGMIVGDMSKQGIFLEFVELDEKEFVQREIDITEIISKEELIETINAQEYDKKEFIEIILIGKRNFEIDTYELHKYIENQQIIKLKNKTRLNFDLSKIADEATLKGMFAKEMQEKMQSKEITQEQKEILQKSIEIAFEALG